MKIRILIATAAVAAVAAFVGLVPAGATVTTYPSVTPGGDCGAPTLTFDNPSHKNAYFRYYEDGQQSDVLTVGKYDQVEKSFGPYAEDSVHTLEYQILDGNPQTSDEPKVPVDVDTNCIPDETSTTTTSTTVPETPTTSTTLPDTLTCADLPPNIPSSSPAYSPDLDQDHDGIACEAPAPAAPARPVVATPSFTG